MSITDNFPTIRPTLNLDFVNSRTVDPRITFTRASTATYYDGRTFAKAEENLLVRSQEFDNAAWDKSSATVTANTGAAPDGTMTADTLTASGANGSALQTFTATEQPYTFSLWVRRTVGTGTVEITADGTTWSAITISGTWTRFSVTVTPSAGSRTAGIRLTTSGDAVEIWGAQLEQRSTVTAYTPTTDQPITRYVPQLMTAAADTPRIDFDPVTGVCRGLLIEEQRTNLLTRSQEFDSAVWNKLSSVVASVNSGVAPDGTQTADFWREDTSTDFHVMTQSPAATGSAGAVYTLSVFVKPAGRTRIVIRTDASGYGLGNALFDLSNFTVESVSGTASSASITNVGNGWARCSVTCTATGSFTLVEFKLISVNESLQRSYTGDGVSGYFVWGAQLEAGAFPTSYIPTTSSQVTRSADSAVMTGENFSSWYRQDEGTFLAVASSQTPSPARLFAADDGNVSNRVALLKASNAQIQFLTMANGVSTTSNAVTLGTAFLTAAAYKANDIAACLNAGTVATDTTASLPTATRIGIGANAAGAYQLNGHIRRIAYWPKRLPNNQLQALTA